MSKRPLEHPLNQPGRLALVSTLASLLLCGCGGAAAQLQSARDLALSGHARSALLEARAALLQLGDARGDEADAVRRGALKLAGDLCALHLDDPKCAAREYRELVLRFPTAPEAFDARARLGDLDLRLGDLRGAVEAWRDQVATSPDRPGACSAQLKIARALVDQGDLAEARRAASELQTRWPTSPLAWQAALLSASTFHIAGRHGDAVAAYRAVADKYRGTQGEPEAMFEVGNCLVDQGDDAHALPVFTAALVKHDSPELVQYALERAQRRLQLGAPVDPRNSSAVWDHLARAGRAVQR